MARRCRHRSRHRALYGAAAAGGESPGQVAPAPRYCEIAASPESRTDTGPGSPSCAPPRPAPAPRWDGTGRKTRGSSWWLRARRHRAPRGPAPLPPRAHLRPPPGTGRDGRGAVQRGAGPRCPPGAHPLAPGGSLCPPVSPGIPPVFTRCLPVSPDVPTVFTRCPPVSPRCSPGVSRGPTVSSDVPMVSPDVPTVFPRCPPVSPRCPPVFTRCPPAPPSPFLGTTGPARCPPIARGICRDGPGAAVPRRGCPGPRWPPVTPALAPPHPR